MSVGGIWQSASVQERQSRADGLLVAAAIGDALGWPHERRARRIEQAGDGGTSPFMRWERNAGSRFRSVPEVIEPGEYSDDTQMIIAVSRSRLMAGNEWLLRLRFAELPFMLAYERGAGATVKRACKAWAVGSAPWELLATRDAYFKSGANGAAMRVIPHVIVHAQSRNFASIADDVAEDAISTHGHPRAVIGALLHAFAHWVSLSRPAPIPYGWLLDELLKRAPEWSGFPPALSESSEWMEAAEKETNGYLPLWSKTVEETKVLLGVAKEAVDETSLKAPADVLAELGVSRGHETGSGTVSAVGAAYLATYNAADPSAGLRTAAMLRGADTDTLASMTASLLAAAVGQDWLIPYRRHVQDSELLSKLSRQLIRAGDQLPLPIPIPERDEIDQMRENIFASREGDEVETPFGRSGRVVGISHLESQKAAVDRWKINITDGQTIYVMKWLPSAQSGRSGTVPAADTAGSRPSIARRERNAVIRGIDVSVRDLGRARGILEELLGLKPDGVGPRWVRYGTTVLRAGEDSNLDTRPFSLRVYVSDPVMLIPQAESLGVPIERDNWPNGAIGLLVEPGFTVVVSP